MGKIYTIGFTKKNAEVFFSLLTINKIDILADVRLSNNGQLAGFTKKNDLEFFLRLFNITYQHWKEFAPLKEIRNIYHSSKNWNNYVRQYKKLIKDRKAVEKINSKLFDQHNVVLLCSEPKPNKCHRRIVAEMIKKRYPDIEIVHL